MKEHFLKIIDFISVLFKPILNRKTIVLVADGTLPTGNYVISSGKTFLVPYNDAHTIITTSNPEKP